MFRLMGHVLPEEKSIWIALTMIYGIGRERSKKILGNLNIPYMKKVSEISEEEQKYIYTIILLNYENKSLQYIPIKIVYKNDINK